MLLACDEPAASMLIACCLRNGPGAECCLSHLHVEDGCVACADSSWLRSHVEIRFEPARKPLRGGFCIILQKVRLCLNLKSDFLSIFKQSLNIYDNSINVRRNLKKLVREDYLDFLVLLHIVSFVAIVIIIDIIYCVDWVGGESKQIWVR